MDKKIKLLIGLILSIFTFLGFFTLAVSVFATTCDNTSYWNGSMCVLKSQTVNTPAGTCTPTTSCTILGCGNTDSCGIYCGDCSARLTPTGFSAVPVVNANGKCQINLSWNAMTGAVNYVLFHYIEVNGQVTSGGFDVGPDTFFHDTGLSGYGLIPNTTYTYELWASLDNNGTPSEHTQIRSTTLGSCQNPSAPPPPDLQLPNLGLIDTNITWNPNPVVVGVPVTFRVPIFNIGGSSTGRSFYNVFLIRDLNTNIVTTLNAVLMPTLAAGATDIAISPPYTFNSLDSIGYDRYQIAVCADKTPNHAYPDPNFLGEVWDDPGVIHESYEGNCGWRLFSVDYPPNPPTINLTFSPSVTPDNVTQYTITESATSAFGAGVINDVRFEINEPQVDSGQTGYDRGYLIWVPGSPAQGSNAIGCTGGGHLIDGGVPYGYMHVDSCSVSDSGNTKTVSFIVRFDPSFTTPITNSISGMVTGPESQTNVGFWHNFGNFTLNLSPLPTVSISANPTSVSYNGSSVITWSSTNATTCTASGGTSGDGWSGSKNATGTFPTGNLTTTTDYSISCSGSGGNSPTQSVTVSVGNQPSPLPTVSISANPTSVSYNGSSVITWSSTNATTCTASGGTSGDGWSGSKNATGTFPTGNLTTTTDYSISCSGSGGNSPTQSVTVSVGNQPSPLPTVSISANPTSVSYNGSSVITWSSTNATTCTASGGTSGDGWSGSKNATGTFPTGNLTTTTDYSISCSGSGGNSPTQSVTVSVGNQPSPLPTVSISANPTSVSYNGSSVITWSSTNATTCTASGGTSGDGWSGSKNATGTFPTGNLTTTTDYSISCSGSGGNSPTQSVTVSVGNQPSPLPTVSISANPTSVSYNGSSVITWSSTNATTCTASGGTSGDGWSGSKNATGTFPTGNLTTTTDYSISCSGSGGNSPTQSVTVSVGNQPSPLPTVSISANPTSVSYNGSSVITWSSTNATTCTASGGTSGDGWSGSKNATGTFPTGNLTTTTDYSISCSGSGGNSPTQSVTVSVGNQPSPLPTVSISANPTSVSYNGSSVITWSSTNATTCTASGGTSGDGWSGSKNATGTFPTGNLTTTTDYSISCSGSGGNSPTQSVTVSVGNNVNNSGGGSLPLNYQHAVVNLSANPTSVSYNGSSVITWSSTNATTCTASGGTSGDGWSGSKNATGTFPTGNLTTTTDYSISCSGSGGNSPTQSVTVSVGNQPSPLPTVSISANPTSVSYNGSSVITWSSTNATTCTASGGTSGDGWSGSKNATGTFPTGNLTTTTDYSISCSGSGGNSPTQSVTVSVGNQPSPLPTVSISANPTSVSYNGSSVITWSSTNATTCTASGGTSGDGWSGIKANSGNFNTRALTNTLSYNINCTNGFRSTSDSVLVAVGRQKIVKQTFTPALLIPITSSMDRNQPTIPTVNNSSKSRNGNVSAKVFGGSANTNTFFGANVLGAGFFPTNLLEWAIVLNLILVIIFLIKFSFSQSLSKKTITTLD